MLKKLIKKLHLLKKINLKIQKIKTLSTRQNIAIFDKIIFLLFLIIVTIIIYKIINFQKFENTKNGNFFNNLSFFINLDYENEIKTFFYKISCYKIFYSLKYNIIETIYYIYAFDDNQNIIRPFDLVFLYDLHIFCNMKSINNSIEIETFPNFDNNRNFICIEHFYNFEKVELGIKIYKKNPTYKLLTTFYYYSNNNFNKSFLVEMNEDKFSHLNIQNEYMELMKKINLSDKELKFKASYIQKPSFETKFSDKNEKNNWIFKKIYDHYFCFCKGLSCNKENSKSFQYCKYYFYLTIIDNNRNLYKKNDYLFVDFIGGYNNDDTFPIFKQMIKQNLSAHYMTVKNDIYNEYCNGKKNCLTIIKNDVINGDFLEKYLSLILKLKVTVAGSEFRSINNLFYNLEYITNINVGHGVKFFKSFLYKDYTSPKKYNKLVLAPSLKIISIAKSYGWKDENIIKICLPKWDKYNNLMNINNIPKSIFIFFTKREIKRLSAERKENKLGISDFFINNIVKLFKNKEFNHELNKNNITLYFGLHQNQNQLKSYVSENFKFIKIIPNKLIPECLIKSNLLITDFSSIIFDFIYQRKPIIIYIPDYEDPKIKDIYTEDYYNLIKNLGNKTIFFENQFYDIKSVINKIIFYIQNDFKLDEKLEIFYKSFGLNCKKNNTETFIDYIKNLN